MFHRKCQRSKIVQWETWAVRKTLKKKNLKNIILTGGTGHRYIPYICIHIGFRREMTQHLSYKSQVLRCISICLCGLIHSVYLRDHSCCRYLMFAYSLPIVFRACWPYCNVQWFALKTQLFIFKCGQCSSYIISFMDSRKRIQM